MKEFNKILVQCKIKGTVDRIDFLRIYEYFCKLYFNHQDYIYTTQKLRLAYFKFEEDIESCIFYKEIEFLEQFIN